MSECIEWWGAHFTNARGEPTYGALYRRRKSMKAHRMIWEECFGEIPDGMWVLHRCDNPPCVNPEHLFLGDAQSNNDDMRQKGRARYPGAPIAQFCVNGHEFTPENTGYSKRSGRDYLMKFCRECSRRRTRASYSYVKKTDPDICRNGHDKREVGRYSRNACAQCARESQARYKARLDVRKVK